MIYKNEVPPPVRAASVWNPDYACFDTPDGKHWRWSSPVPGAESRDGVGHPVLVAVWLDTSMNAALAGWSEA